jgi:hypothetical protein
LPAGKQALNHFSLTQYPKRAKYSRTVTFTEGMKAMKYTPQDIGGLIRETRKGLGVTQKALALAAAGRC